MKQALFVAAALFAGGCSRPAPHVTTEPAPAPVFEGDEHTASPVEVGQAPGDAGPGGMRDGGLGSTVRDGGVVGIAGGDAGTARPGSPSPGAGAGSGSGAGSGAAPGGGSPRAPTPGR